MEERYEEVKDELELAKKDLAETIQNLLKTLNRK